MATHAGHGLEIQFADSFSMPASVVVPVLGRFFPAALMAQLKQQSSH
jgi:hypothetical protein